MVVAGYMAVEHLKYGKPKLSCAISVKDTTDFKDLGAKKNTVKLLIRLFFYVGCLLKLGLPDFKKNAHLTEYQVNNR